MTSLVSTSYYPIYVRMFTDGAKFAIPMGHYFVTSPLQSIYISTWSSTWNLLFNKPKFVCRKAGHFHEV